MCNEEALQLSGYLCKTNSLPTPSNDWPWLISRTDQGCLVTPLALCFFYKLLKVERLSGQMGTEDVEKNMKTTPVPSVLRISYYVCIMSFIITEVNSVKYPPTPRKKVT